MQTLDHKNDKVKPISCNSKTFIPHDKKTDDPIGQYFAPLFTTACSSDNEGFFTFLVEKHIAEYGKEAWTTLIDNEKDIFELIIDYNAIKCLKALPVKDTVSRFIYANTNLSTCLDYAASRGKIEICSYIIKNMTNYQKNKYFNNEEKKRLTFVQNLFDSMYISKESLCFGEHAFLGFLPKKAFLNKNCDNENALFHAFKTKYIPFISVCLFNMNDKEIRETKDKNNCSILYYAIKDENYSFIETILNKAKTLKVKRPNNIEPEMSIKIEYEILKEKTPMGITCEEFLELKKKINPQSIKPRTLPSIFSNAKEFKEFEKTNYYHANILKYNIPIALNEETPQLLKTIIGTYGTSFLYNEKYFYLWEYIEKNINEELFFKTVLLAHAPNNQFFECPKKPSNCQKILEIIHKKYTNYFNYPKSIIQNRIFTHILIDRSSEEFEWLLKIFDLKILPEHFHHALILKNFHLINLFIQAGFSTDFEIAKNTSFLKALALFKEQKPCQED